MVEVYYYVPAECVSEIIECGMKLSKWCDKEVYINGENRKVLSALLNPKDDIEKYKSDELKCIKLEISTDYCYAADRYLYIAGGNSPELMNMYTNSIIPLKDYRFGTYRLPECLVTSTIIPGYIRVLDKRMDSPVLFDRSEDLYISNILEEYREEHEGFHDCLLYNFYSKLSETGKLDKFEDAGNRIAVFVEKDTGRNFTVRVPDMEAYG